MRGEALTEPVGEHGFSAYRRSLLLAWRPGRLRYILSLTRSGVFFRLPGLDEGVAQVDAGPGDLAHEAHIVGPAVPRLEAPGQVDVAHIDAQLLPRLQIALAEPVQMLGEGLDDVRISAPFVAMAIEAGIAELLGMIEMHVHLRGWCALCHAVEASSIKT